ncbi:24128_t:CDS:1, partial [Cetraspora pellucida]
IQDIIFSCRYTTALPNPRDIALTLLQQHTPLLQLPTLPFQYQNTFAYYLNEPQTFSFEELGNFSQFFRNLESPILQATSTDNSVHITALLEDTHHFYEPEDSLLLYSEEVTYQTPLETNDTPSWIIHLDQENILEPRNSSNEGPDSDYELNIDLADLVYTAPPSPPP